MKEKRKIIIYARVVKRFKKIFGAFIVLFGIQYMISKTVKSVRDAEIEENEDEFGSFFAVQAEDKTDDPEMDPFESLARSRNVFCDPKTGQ